MRVRLFSFASVIAACGIGALILGAGCGGDDDAGADAGPPRSARLVIQPPPGDIIGLPFNGTITLRVLYETEAGEPIPDETVHFAILASAVDEDPGGATLSSNQATTDAQGIARVDLQGGAERTHFRVEVSAADAPSSRYYVNVSEAGFARLIVTPVHEGWREPEVFERIELRLYRSAELRCADMAIDDLPPAAFPPRSLAGFGGTATYQSVSAGEDYTLVAWTLIPESTTRISAGCMDLGAGQVPSGDIALSLVVHDRSLVLPSTVVLSSSFELGPVAAAMTATGSDRPWKVLECPSGPGQLLLDCTLDAMAPDGTLDCRVTSLDPIVAEVEALRGAADAAGCRPASVGSEPSLDQRLLDAVAAGGGWPVGPNLTALLDARADTLDSFELFSSLTIVGPSSARHRLEVARLEVAGTPFELDLLASNRPVLQQSQVPIGSTPLPALAIGEHGFTLRYGSIAQAAFVALGLAPRGLGARAHELGVALAESASYGASEPGCHSVSAILCGAVSAPADCAHTACTIAALHLDTELGAWSAQLDGAGLDLGLVGEAPLYDHDNDLHVDDIGRSSEAIATGTWTAAFTLATGQTATTAADFGTTPETAPE